MTLEMITPTYMSDRFRLGEEFYFHQVKDIVESRQKSFDLHDCLRTVPIGSNYEQIDNQDPMLAAFGNIHIKENHQKEKICLVRELNGEEEELFSQDCTVVWGKFSEISSKFSLSATMKTPIVALCWANFLLPDKNFVEKQAVSIFDNPTGRQQSGVGIFEAEHFSYIANNGEKYSAKLPCQVSSVWPILSTILVERKPLETDYSPSESRPPLFSMFTITHPLDEISPVIMKTPNPDGTYKVSFVTDVKEKIIFVCDDPLIVVTVNTSTYRHSIWKLKKALQEEYTNLYAVHPDGQANVALHAMSHHTSTVTLAATTTDVTLGPDDNPAYEQTQCLSPFAASLSRLKNAGYRKDIPSRLNDIGKRFQSQEERSTVISTPKCKTEVDLHDDPREVFTNRPLTTIQERKQNVPSVTFQQLKTKRRSVATDHLSIYDVDSIAGKGEDGVPTEEPLLPKACLELIWSEVLHTGPRTIPFQITVPSSTPLHQSNKNSLRVDTLKASYNKYHPSSSTPDLSNKHKISNAIDSQNNVTPCGFIAEDLASHLWICFLCPSQYRLTCIPCTVENNSCNQLSLGSPHSIQARDAKYLRNKKLTVVLDHTGSNIFLYSGIKKICMLSSVVPSVTCNPWSPHHTSQLGGQNQQSLNIDQKIVNCHSTLPSTDFIDHTIKSGRHSFLQKFHDDISGISPVRRSSLEPSNKSRLSLTGSTLDTSIRIEAPPKHMINISTRYLSIKEATENAFSVELSNEKLVRVYLPKIAETRLVRKCLVALQKVLPNDLGVNLLSRWYTIRNSPGRKDTNISNSEWAQFNDFLLTLSGFVRSQDLSMDEENFTSEAFKIDSHNNSGNTETSPKMTDTILQINNAPPAKKPCSDSNYCDSHWDLLLSRLNLFDNPIASTVTASIMGQYDISKFLNKSSQCNQVLLKDVLRAETMNSILLNHLPSVLFVLHAVYECEKMNSLSWCGVEDLALLNFFIAKSLSLKHYMTYYAKDFPKISSCLSFVPEVDTSQVYWPIYFEEQACDLFDWVSRFFSNQSVRPYPHIPGVNDLSVQIITASIIMSDRLNTENYSSVLRSYIQDICATDCQQHILHECFHTDDNHCLSSFQRVVLYLSEVGITSDILDRLPVGLSLLFRCALEECRSNPPPSCSTTSYSLIGRNDFSEQMQILSASNDGKTPMERWSEIVKPYWDLPRHRNCKESKYPILSLLESDPAVQMSFKSDLRIREAYRLLQSSTRVKVFSSLRPDATEQEVSEELESQLLAASVRTMALSVGRGMLTLSCQVANVPAQLQVEKLCLNGRSVNTRHSNVDLTKIDTPPTMKLWPEFHNGVATGLMITRKANINSTWILYNCRPKGAGDNSPEKAGIIFALGLQGHLNKLHQCYIRDYMKKLHDISNMAMILGLCAGKRGTMEDTLTRTVAVHFKRLLPASTAELDVPSLSQAGAIMGLGLLYEGSSHRHIAQLLLEEMGKSAGPDLEASMEREVLSLLCGFSLGLIMLKHCEHDFNVSDVSMAEKLHAYMVGGHRHSSSQSRDDMTSINGYGSNTLKPSGLTASSRQQTGSFSSTPSNPQIREEDRYNVDVTSPGATVALGLMFFGSGNRCISEWLSIPDTQYLLDFVRPDLLQLRMIALGLVNWQSIEPTESWIASHMPPVLAKYAFKKSLFKDDTNCDIDFETMNLSCLHMMAGCCFVMGIRFAGTCNEKAAVTLRKVLGIILEGAANINNPKIILKPPQIEQATAIVLLSISVVMAGSGNVEILQIIRRLRSRIGPQLMYSVNYGCHMIYSMAIGLLFLGGGRLTLSNKPEAAAILLISLFPRFPSFSSDNRYHLQALRHLYVLAVEPRRLVAVDVDTHQVVSTNMCATLKNGEKFWSQDSIIVPPDLFHNLESIEINYQSEWYWPHIFRSACSDWNIFRDSLKQGGYIFVKKKYKKDITDGLKLKPLVSHHLSHWLSARHLYQLKMIVCFTKFCKCQSLNGISHQIAMALHKEFMKNRKELQASLFSYYHEYSKDCSTLLNAFLIWFSLPSNEDLPPSFLPKETPPIKGFLEALRNSPYHLPVESAWWLYKIAYNM